MCFSVSPKGTSQGKDFFHTIGLFSEWSQEAIEKEGVQDWEGKEADNFILCSLWAGYHHVQLWLSSTGTQQRLCRIEQNHPDWGMRK